MGPQIISDGSDSEKEMMSIDNSNYFTTSDSVCSINDVVSKNITLNPKYSFSNFIVGKQNELAHAASQAVSSQLGGVYNPLFLYGGVGLGKTHLLQAVGNEIKKQNPEKKVLYVTCETFTNDFINAVRTGKAKEFKDNYRTVDLLLIDDIQFITGKEGTQEEFFHTFNALHQNNKQIILSSDRPPKAIPALENRLLSRFEWGMMADIGSPDFETRTAILSSKCREKNYILEAEILHHIATVIQRNVRELEGALNKIIAFHQFKNIIPTIESTKPILASFQPTKTNKTVTPKQVIQTVATYFDLQIPELLGKSREKRLAFPRQIIMFILREEMKASYPSIGTELGGRDHTTAMHAYDKISCRLQDDEKLQNDLELIKQRLYAV
jgi:chromosomal replication initiator protein